MKKSVPHIKEELNQVAQTNFHASVGHFRASAAAAVQHACANYCPDCWKL